MQPSFISQVRRMIGAAVGVSNGSMELEHVEQMLMEPNTGWNPKGESVKHFCINSILVNVNFRLCKC